MALVVEDGTGLVAADSYVSVADADTYHTNHGTSASWVDQVAQATLTLGVQPTATDMIVLDSVTYTFVSTLASVNDILIGSALADTQANFVSAVTRAGIPGLDYHASTVVHPTVTAAAFSTTNTCVISAKVGGVAGNSLVSTETFTSVQNFIDGATLGTTTLGAATKEASLKIATAYLDSRYSGAWRGRKKTSTQALAWPRCAAYDDEGYLLSETAIPTLLANVTALAALKIHTGDVFLPDLTANAPIKRERSKVGPLEDEVEYFGGGKTEGVTTFSELNVLVSGLIHTNTLQRG